MRRLRFLAGLYQQQLADRIGVSQSRISQIESGRDTRRLTPRMIYDLADALGVDVETLVGDDRTIDLSAIVSGGNARPSASERARPVAELIGRQDDLDYLRKLLRKGAERLVTLVGPGGVGKTQLALHVAREAADSYPPRPIVVFLADATDTATVLYAVALALGLRERDAHPIRQRVIETLRQKRMLLVLDSVEHVAVAVAALVIDLLHECPDLAVLATGRIALDVTDEFVYDVLPLVTPDLAQVGLPETVAASPAVQLFVKRACNVVPWFTVDAFNAADVAAICRRLGGLPLAIELAAPRLRIYSPRQLVHELDSQLTLLVGGGNDRPERHQSLRACVKWSYDLLIPEHQTVFRTLGAFAGGFTLDAAVFVLHHSQRVAPATTTLSMSESSRAVVEETVLALAEQNLITRSELSDGTVRFSMLEAIQEFARQQLIASCQSARVLRAHLTWARSLAEQAAKAMFTSDELAWVRRLNGERENIGAALQWGFAQSDLGDRESTLQLAAALVDYWYVTGQLTTARQWLVRVDSLADDHGPTIGRGRCLIGACQIEQVLGNTDSAAVHCESGLRVAHALGDQAFIGRGLLLLGNLALMHGDFADARELHQAALENFSDRGDLPWKALALLDLAVDSLREHDTTRAKEYVVEARAIAQRVGDHWEDLAAALVLGDIGLVDGEYDRAERSFIDSLSAAWKLGGERDMADALSGLAVVALRSGSPRRAAIFAAASENLYRRVGVSVPPPLRPNWPAMVAEIHAALADLDSRLDPATVIPERVIIDILGRLRARSVRRHDHRPRAVARKIRRGTMRIRLPHPEWAASIGIMWTFLQLAAAWA